MISKMLSVILVVTLLHGNIVAQDQSQSPPQTVAKMQQVLRKAQEKDKAVKVTLNKKTDNQNKFSGKVSDISDTAFLITDQKTGATKKLAYEDVRQVNQKGLSKGAKIAIGVGVGVALFLVVAAIVIEATGIGD